MTPEEALDLLADLESDRVERTVSRDKTDKFGEAVCAFANDLPDHRKPGYLFVGVDPSGRPDGNEISERLLENLGALRSDGNLLPPPSLTVEKIDLPEGSVALVTVQPSQDTPIRYKGKVYLRSGPRRGTANPEDERRLIEKRAAFLARTWDARPNLESTLDDLALDLFALGYRRSAVDAQVIEENERPIDQQLAALRFFDPRTNCPNHAAVLLFGRDPQFFYPNAYVQYVRYAGRDQAADVSEDRRLSGDLGGVFRRLDDLGKDLAVARPIGAEGFREVVTYDYPPRALRELFVNAVIHRSYEFPSPILINHFADRLEILNPGGLYPDLSERDFESRTAYRNPILAEAARVLGYANRFGRGITVARTELRKNASPDPEFLIRENFFHVIVRKRP